jgi:DNA-binding SARP family transcriptional activator/tetratricopeptide (TPR) repeat protein
MSKGGTVKKLTICLLGDVVFRLDDGSPLSLAAGKTGALLAYLAVETAHPHPRQILAEWFWPERTDAEALSALRFALSNLRAVLHDRDAAIPFLLIDRARVQLNPEANIWVDAVSFRDQAAACETAPSMEALREILALYRGPFLQGFNLGDSLDFESWALRTREQLERQRLRLLYLLGADQETASDYAQAAETYRVILETQPWNERAHQCLMRVLDANGQTGAALAQYAMCHRALDELGIEPGRLTNALYQQIKQEQGMPSIEDVAPFVARERELARLAIALERVLAGQGQVVLVTGEAGSGKTALLRAFVHPALARHPDLLLVGGRCDAHAGVGWPYQPFIESVRVLAGECEALLWVEQLSAKSQERLRQALPQIAQTLVETAPDLLGRVVDPIELAQRVQTEIARVRPLPAWQKTLRHGAASPATQRGPDSGLETGRLFEQIARLFTALARQRPLVLLLDDLQWIDAGSAALLFHLARRIVHSRLLLVAAYRPGDVVNHQAETDPHPLLGVVTELQRYGGDIRIDLDQVDEQAFVATLLEKDPLLHPNRLDAAFCTALARRTGGNPLFTIELLRSLQAHNEIRRAPDGSWVSNPSLNWAHLPERVEAAIAGRIGNLPAKWRDWLTTASVEGESFTAEVLAQVHGVDVAALLHDLSGPLGMGRGARRLVQGEGTHWLEQGDQPRRLSRYRFRHILFQFYLYQQLDPAERARRHAAVGLALEALYEDQPKARAWRASELARHFEAGGRSEKATAYYLKAGQQAVYLGSPQSAVAHYRHGLTLLADQPHTPARDRLEIRLHLALGAPFLSADGWGGPERQAAIQRALELLQATGRADRQPPGTAWDELLLALHAQADWLLSQGELEQAVQRGEHILALAGEQPSLPVALAHRILGMSRLFQGRFPEARQHLDGALAAYDAIGQPVTLPWIGGDLQATCRALLGFVLAVSGHLDQAWAQASQALHRARRIKHLPALGTTLIFACEVAVLRGDLPALNALAGELLDVGETEGLRFFLAYGWAAEGYAQAAQAKPGSEQAGANLELIRRGLRLWESTATQAGYGMWIVRLADACLQAGDIVAGLAITAAILATPTQPGITVGLSHIYRLHGELLLRQETPDRRAAAAHKAEAYFEQALDIARQQGAHTLALRAALSLAKLWQATQPETARRLLAATYAWFSEGLDTPDLQEAAALLSSAG